MALEGILARKRREVARRRAERPLEGVDLRPTDRDFLAALREAAPAFILEVKPASPSEGRLRDPAGLDQVIAACARHASAISVLADGPAFGGSLALLARVRSRARQPVLCKDFVVDPYQVLEARAHGADAILLMLSVLDDAAYRGCAAAARALGMGILTEVHDAGEMRRAEALGAEVIGINNRDLRTLQVSLDTTAALAPRAPAGAVLIAESGLRTAADVARLRPVVDGFLIGTALMRAADPEAAARELIYGATKVCGLTREADAAAAARAGATHGGLVFASESPRRVTPRRAAALVRSAPLRWVGVFVNEPIDRVAGLAAALGLAAVQLHGDEGPDQVAALRARLPADCAVWKAAPAAGGIPDWRATGADLVLLDGAGGGARGGTGRPFDWSVLTGLGDRHRYGLAGGLRPENAPAAARLGLALLDLCSGVERAPGIKDPALLARFFAARRGGRRPGDA